MKTFSMLRYFILTLLLIGCINIRFSINIWLLLTDSDYVIPKESSVFVFKPTTANAGSGDWWSYGKDYDYYYYFTGNGNATYYRISKEDAKKCKGFKENDFKTWCGLNL